MPLKHARLPSQSLSFLQHTKMAEAQSTLLRQTCGVVWVCSIIHATDGLGGRAHLFQPVPKGCLPCQSTVHNPAPCSTGL